MPAAIEVSGLVKRYGGQPVVDGLSFTVEQGEVFALLGPNGAGKTTTVEILEGFRTADSGHARVLGLDPRRDARRLRERIGVMPQDGKLHPRVRPPEIVRTFARFYENPVEPSEALRIVGLEGVNTPFRRLSGGQQQRLSLALALIGRPEVAFLDEPTAGLDAHGRAAAWELIRGLRAAGRTVLLTTHMIDEAERLADHVAIVHHGRMVAAGTPASIVAAASRPELRFRALPGIDAAALATASGGIAVEERPGEYRVTPGGDTTVALAGVTAWLAERGVAVSDLTVGTRSLEDVFLELTREPSQAALGGAAQ